MGTPKEARGNFPFSSACYFLNCVYMTPSISYGGRRYVNSGTAAVQKGLGQIKENNKHVSGIWTSAATLALTPRPWQFHESKHSSVFLIKQNQHLSWESEQRCWQVHRANDNTIAEMRGTSVPPTLLKQCAFKHSHWTVKPRKPLSCPYCPFHSALK